MATFILEPEQTTNINISVCFEDHQQPAVFR